MSADMLEFYNMTEKNNVNIIYSGMIWADGIEGLGEILRKRMEFEEMPLSASLAVFSVFVEQMNNMLMYSEEKQKTRGRPADAPQGVFILGSKDKVYTAQSGNMMKNENVEEMKKRIDHLNSLDKPGLRKYYMEQIRNENKNTGSKGGGLGLIEIAKRASAPIQYDFKPRGGGLTFFTMCVTVGREEDKRQ
jgi:hypothetical protein